MPNIAFNHVDTWVFDLDNTLYPPSARLFDLIEVRMTAWVMQSLGVDHARADYLRQHYWQTYGTTLAGLMREYDVDPAPYLHEVHEIALDRLLPDPVLAARIGALQGRRIIYTNGTAPYAERVIAARGLSGLFDAVYGVEHAGYLPKPEQGAFDRIFATDGLRPGTAVMFEDDPRNLLIPHALGMGTVHVAPTAAPQDHIHFHTDDLGSFLGRITGKFGA